MILDQIQPWLNNAPTLAQVLAGVSVLVGTVLWSCGRKLARLFVAIAGLLVGGGTAILLGEQFGHAGLMLALIVAGAVAGYLLIWFLFRVAMGLSLAVTLAIVAPFALLFIQGDPMPPIGQDLESYKRSLAGQKLTLIDEGLPSADAGPDSGLFQSPSGDDSTPPPADGKPSSVDQAREAAGVVMNWLKPLFGLAHDQGDALRYWWNERSVGKQRVLGVTAVAGLFVGLFAGLFLPNVAAALASSLLGALLALTGVKVLVLAFLPSQSHYLPNSPSMTLVTLGLITVMGVLLQWIIWGRPDDK